MGEPTAHRLGGRYEMRSLIGRGGMAEVHLGFDTRLNRVVAIKKLRTDLARDAVFQARFRREAQSAAQLNHPNIVAVYDTGEEAIETPDGRTVSVPYIVMEYVEGHTVKDVLRNGNALPIDEAVDIVTGVLAALEYSHERGIVHRDIKPGNIMLTPTGKVKVMDFGIARALTDSQATMTQTNAVVGTAQYLSPEQARGEQVDARSDLYSAGVVLFELLTGQPPFRGDSAVAVAYQHVQELPDLPSSIAADVPEALDRVVMKALAKNRDDRYPTATAMRADLLRAVGGAAVNAPATSVWAATLPAETEVTRALPPTPPPPPVWTGAPRSSTATSTMTAVGVPEPEEEPRKKRAWLILLLVLVALGLVGGAWALLRSTGEADNPLVAVPDVTNQSQADAKSTLEAAGLTMVVDENGVASDEVEKGKVAKSDPGAGSQVSAGSAVTVFLSTGPASTTVPTGLIGMTPDEAKAAVEAAGLTWKLSETKVSSDTVEEGKVAHVNPSEGSKVNAGQTVEVQLSSGPDQVEVPNVAGMDQDQARSVLQNAGLSLGNVDTVDSHEQAKGKIVTSTPAAGEKVKRGSSVNVSIATGDVVLPQGLAGQSQDAVTQAIADLGLSYQIMQQASNDVAAGTVISVVPTEGQKVSQDSVVKIYVSTGPAATTTTGGNGNGNGSGNSGGGTGGGNGSSNR